MRKRPTDVFDVDDLLTSFINNDPYYPRPQHTDPIYRQFREGYLRAHPKTDQGRLIAKNFLRRLEHKVGVDLAAKGAAESAAEEAAKLKAEKKEDLEVEGKSE